MSLVLNMFPFTFSWRQWCLWHPIFRVEWLYLWYVTGFASAHLASKHWWYLPAYLVTYAYPSPEPKVSFFFSGMWFHKRMVTGLLMISHVLVSKYADSNLHWQFHESPWSLSRPYFAVEDTGFMPLTHDAQVILVSEHGTAEGNNPLLYFFWYFILPVLLELQRLIPMIWCILWSFNFYVHLSVFSVMNFSELSSKLFFFTTGQNLLHTMDFLKMSILCSKIFCERNCFQILMTFRGLWELTVQQCQGSSPFLAVFCFVFAFLLLAFDLVGILLPRYRINPLKFFLAIGT